VIETAEELVDRCYWRLLARVEVAEGDVAVVGLRSLLAEVIAEMDARWARRRVVEFEAGRFGYPGSDN
jgi:hypothetical protein